MNIKCTYTSHRLEALRTGTYINDYLFCDHVFNPQVILSWISKHRKNTYYLIN